MALQRKGVGVAKINTKYTVKGAGAQRTEELHLSANLKPCSLWLGTERLEHWQGQCLTLLSWQQLLGGSLW